MRCEEFASVLEAWLDGELDAETAAAAAAHRAACPACAAATAARLRLREALRSELAATPPADLRAAVLSAAIAPAPVRRWRPARVAMLAAAALLLAALGLRALLGGDGAAGQHGCRVVAFLDGAYEEAGAIRTGELKLVVGPGALAAPRPRER